MEVLNYQKAFARLLTNQKLRDDFFNGKIQNFSDINLTNSQINSLSQLDYSMTEVYSKMLVATRLSIALNALPYTKQLLPENFIEKILSIYEERVPPAQPEGSPTLEEVKRFDRFLKDSSLEIGDLSPYLRDICHYEANLFIFKNQQVSMVKNADKSENKNNSQLNLLSKPKMSSEILIIDFEYNVPKLLASLRKQLPQADKKETILVFTRSEEKVSIKTITKFISEILLLCDGSRTVSEICETYHGKLTRNLQEKELIQKTIEQSLKKMIELDFLILAE